MKKHRKQLLCLLLCCVLLLPIPCFAATAADMLPEERYVKWTLSEDRKTLTGNGKTYTHYQNSDLGATVILSERRYHFATEFSFRPPNIEGEEEICTVQSSGPNSELAWIEWQDHITVYATSRAAQRLDELIEGKAESYRLLDESYNQTAVEDSLMNTLQALRSSPNAVGKLYHASVLGGKEPYRVGGVDANQSFMCVYGLVYEMADGYYYLDIAGDNIDYTGNSFSVGKSYRLYKLDTDTAKTLDGLLERLEYHPLEHVYEEREVREEIEREQLAQSEKPTGEERSQGGFVALFVIFGLIPPAVALVFGLLLPRSKRLRHPKHWYVIAYAAMLWLVAAVSLMILLSAI